LVIFIVVNPFTTTLIVINNPIKKYFHNDDNVIELKYSVFDMLGNTGNISKAYKLLK